MLAPLGIEQHGAFVATDPEPPVALGQQRLDMGNAGLALIEALGAAAEQV